MDRLVRDDRKTTVTQIITRYNQDLQNTNNPRTFLKTVCSNTMDYLQKPGTDSQSLVHLSNVSTNWHITVCGILSERLDGIQLHFY